MKKKEGKRGEYILRVLNYSVVPRKAHKGIWVSVCLSQSCFMLQEWTSHAQFLAQSILKEQPQFENGGGCQLHFLQWEI